MRRDLFLGLSGYRDILIHQSEEEDYSVRLLNAGFITRAGNADPVHHFESPKRSLARMDFYGARNKVLYAWHNVPFPHLVKHSDYVHLDDFDIRPSSDALPYPLARNHGRLRGGIFRQNETATELEAQFTN